MARQHHACTATLHHFTQIIVQVQYVAGIWILFFRICNSSRALHWFENQIQRRPSQFSSNDKRIIQSQEIDDAVANRN
jgi:hypothetical protein